MGLDPTDVDFVRALLRCGSSARLAAERKVTTRTIRNHRAAHGRPPAGLCPGRVAGLPHTTWAMSCSAQIRHQARRARFGPRPQLPRMVRPALSGPASKASHQNVGLRFSRKALMPSWASGVVTAAAITWVAYS